MRPLIGVDWGTSALRAARIAADGALLEERSAPRGILTVAAGGFPAVLAEVCGDWLQAPGALCLVSGMAGSRQGWQEAPYCPCPAGAAALASQLAWVDRGRTGIVPGLSCEDAGVPDVLRGEEVQVLGAMELLGRDGGTFVLPGTHSKWVQVEDGRMVRFATFMAGEMYALLRTHSILARTLPAEEPPLDAAAFERGVQHARAATSLLRCAFSVRTLSLFDRMAPDASASYLSGLVIGEELRAQPSIPPALTLVGSNALTERYALALANWGCAATRLANEATWRGLRTIANLLEP